MSPVIAFDITVVAQKVKVGVYIMADMLNLKKWGGGCITNRSGWLTSNLYHPKITQAFVSYPDDIWIKNTRIDKFGTHLREEETVAVDMAMSLLVLCG